MPARTKSGTRKDYIKQHFEEYREVLEEMRSDPEAHWKNYLEHKQVKEDERIWAWYRDPKSNLTQVEARDRGQRVPYPDQYNISQSAVSRLVQDLDKRMLTEGPADRGNLLDEVCYKMLETEAPVVLERYRQTLARFLADADALWLLHQKSSPPEWASSRFPDLPDKVEQDPEKDY